jgi:hypothetical protein
MLLDQRRLDDSLPPPPAKDPPGEPPKRKMVHCMFCFDFVPVPCTSVAASERC